MALEAVKKTVFNFGPSDPGGNRMKMLFGTIDFGDLYPTGGEPLDFSEEIADLQGVLITSTDGYVFEYDYDEQTVIVYFFDYDNSSDGPAIEIENETDLTPLTGVVFFAWGF